MNQNERREYLIRSLLEERPEYKKMQLPSARAEQKELLRGLMNVRAPAPISEEFLSVQDEYLQQALAENGVLDPADLPEIRPGIILWQGDITRLKAGAIVNAANSGMTGCYRPNHACIDNCIHTFAGIQLRLACAELMEAQGHEEPTGRAKITPGFNLPCDYVLHTVGPIVQGSLTPRHEELLASCYRSCLDLAAANGVKSIAFCCISTGVFMFPNRRAAEIAVETVEQWLKENESTMQVIFNVFKDEDLRIYQRLLSR